MIITPTTTNRLFPVGPHDLRKETHLLHVLLIQALKSHEDTLPHIKTGNFKRRMLGENMCSSVLDRASREMGDDEHDGLSYY